MADTLSDKKAIRELSLVLLQQSESDHVDWPAIEQYAVELRLLARAKQLPDIAQQVAHARELLRGI